MGILLFLILCTLILIAKPSGPPIPEDLDEKIERIERRSVINQTGQPKPEELWEPEMPMTWLVHDTRAFWLGRTSAGDHSVDLRLNYQEWLAIFFDALELDKSAFEVTAAKLAAQGQGRSFLVEFDDDITEFPMLSRIRGPFHDAVFEREEVSKLRDECVILQGRTSNPNASGGLRKLIQICDKAVDVNLSIYLISNAS